MGIFLVKTFGVLLPWLSCFCAGAAGEARAKALDSLANRELLLPSYQASVFRRDLPVRALTLSGSHSLWMVGQQHIWKWGLHGGRLSRISLPPEAAAVHMQLLAHGDTLYMASGRHLWQMHFAPDKIFRYEAQGFPAGTEAGGLNIQGKRLIWTLSTGVILVDPRQRNSRILFRTPDPQPEDRLMFVADTKKIVLLRKQRLISFDPVNSPGRPPLAIFSLSDEHLNLVPYQRGFFAFSPYSVFIPGKGGDTKSLPVEGKASLLRAFLSEYQHAYLFADGYVEVYRTSQKQGFYSRILAEPVAEAGDFISKGSVLALSDRGKPRVFQLEGVW